MLFLWIFGDNVEGSMSHSRFFDLLCCLRRPSRHDSGDDEPWIDAADGRREWRHLVLGAYFLLHPLASIRVLFFLGFIPIVAHVPALIVLGLWFATQIASATCYLLSEPGVAVWAHVEDSLPA
jgi:rhomboid family protein